MKAFGIDFVSLNPPLMKNQLEALAACVWYIIYIGIIPAGISLTVYLLFFTQFWPLMSAYLFWIWVIDKNVGERGGRPSKWLRSMALFKYVVNYFPITVKSVPDFQLDPKRNYLMCSFPHGYLPIGIGTALGTDGSEEGQKLLPHHSKYATTLNSNFFLPFARDYYLAIGCTSATTKGLDWVLSHPEGGKIAGLFVGGVREAMLCQEGEYHIVLKNRKGFVKIALKNGSPIIPAFSFGQTSTFRMPTFAKDSFVGHAQNFIKSLTGLAFPIFYGRGLFQNSFGCIPLQKAINIVVGHPIDVPKIENPTREEIDTYHKLFVEKLCEIFEKYKHEYEEHPEQRTLIIC